MELIPWSSAGTGLLFGAAMFFIGLLAGTQLKGRD